MAVPRLRIVLGDHPHVLPLKRGDIRPAGFEIEFVDYAPTHAAFKPMVRQQAFDVCEMAVVTYLMAKAYGKPLALLPAAMLGRHQFAYAAYNGDRGVLGPRDLEGKRVGIRSFTTTTGAWLRGILANDYGVDLDRIRWMTFEDPHVEEYRDTTERAPAGREILSMLLDGEIDVALGEMASREPLKPLFADPVADAFTWFARHGVMPVNHLVVVKAELAREQPDVVRELYELLKQSKAKAGPPPSPDPVPFGVEANRKSLELIGLYAVEQGLIPRGFEVDELFDPVARAFD